MTVTDGNPASVTRPARRSAPSPTVRPVPGRAAGALAAVAPTLVQH